MMYSATVIKDQEEQDLQSEEAKCVRGEEGEREGTRLCQENPLRFSLESDKGLQGICGCFKPHQKGPAAATASDPVTSCEKRALTAW